MTRGPVAARCVLIGDVMMDVTAVIETDFAFASDTPARVSLQPGGAAANTAAWMGAYGHRPVVVGCIGDDAFGLALTSALTALGVDLRLRTSDRHPTGTCIVIVDRQRERTMFPDAGANSALGPSMVLDGVIAAGRHVHLSGYTLLNPASRVAGLAAVEEATRVGCTLSLDPASAGPLGAAVDLFSQVLPHVDVLIANEAEARVLTGAADSQGAIDQLLAQVPVVVVKRGPRGVLARSAYERVDVPSRAASVLDTTGAGDAFTAGFLPAWSAGGTLEAAVQAGQDIAAVAVGRVGGGPPVP